MQKRITKLKIRNRFTRIIMLNANVCKAVVTHKFWKIRVILLYMYEIIGVILNASMGNVNIFYGSFTSWQLL